ncbi:MAG: CvpA family protein [Acetobacteraceae bacterium]|nr:CvpA family protein [Acetobacteraceae bacterium]
MTWVDGAVLAVLALSALLAFMRGLVREVLGLAAWAGALLAASWVLPYARPNFRRWLGAPELVDPVAFGVVFFLTLILLLLISSWIGRLVRFSALGGLDRTLGILFGLARGAALVVLAYIVGGLLVPITLWPGAVLEARSLPWAWEGASWVVAQLPPEYRPHLSPPPLGREATADALLRATPRGRATVKPVARE